MGLLDDDGDAVKAEIARLEQQIAQLTGAAPGMGGAQQQQQFQPTIAPEQMRQVYGLLAEYGDDPAAIGHQFVGSMQGNDRLKVANRASQQRTTDAMLARPVGGGYLGQSGSQVMPVWVPDGKGGGEFRFDRGPKRMQPSFKMGGVDYIIDPTDPTGQNLVPAVDPQTVGENAGTVKEETNLGGARGTSRADAEEVFGMLDMQDKEISSMLIDPNFEGGVGLLDQYTGKVGAQFGFDEGLVTKKAAFISNALTTSKVKDWKGAISNAELNFFKSSVPQPGDGPDVWREWYENSFRPFKEFVRARAKGEISLGNSDLSTYLTGGSGDSGGGGYTEEEKAALRAAGVEVD